MKYTRCKYCGREIETMQLRTGEYVTIDKQCSRFDESDKGNEFATFNGILVIGIPNRSGKRMGNMLHRSSCRQYAVEAQRMKALQRKIENRKKREQKQAKELEKRLKEITERNKQMSFL